MLKRFDRKEREGALPGIIAFLAGLLFITSAWWGERILLFGVTAGALRILWGCVMADPVVGGGIAAMFLTAIFFMCLLSVMTSAGVRIREKIQSLAFFMNTAERHRQALLNPPEETPELFEKLLPYALALDVVETWKNSFRFLLEKARYEPSWNRGMYNAERFDAMK